MKPAGNELHYTRSVIELSDILPVITSQAVFSTTGIKLVSEQVRLDSMFFERLAQHHMAPPLEQCLIVEGGVDHAELIETARRLLKNEPQLARMAEHIPDIDGLWGAVAAIPLSEPVQFLLTLAREKRSRLLTHSVVVMLIALYLGVRLGMGQRQLTELATAALLHDIGELRLDERLFEADRPLTAAGRQQIYLHPLITQAILGSSREYSSEVVNAAAQHHERMDGSGYPGRLSGQEIARLAQIVALAEVAGSKVGDQQQGGMRLEVILKLNSQQFAADLLGYLTVLYAGAVNQSPLTVQHIHAQLEKIGMAIEQWKMLTANILIKGKSSAGLIQLRLEGLRVALLDAGLNPADKHSTTAGIENDGKALDELDQLCQETLWQIRSVILELKRTYPEYEADISEMGQAVKSWLPQTEALLHE